MKEAEKIEIYNKIRALLREYEPPFVAREGKNVSGKQSVELWAKGKYEVNGKQRNEIYFAGLIIQKDYVGFYFMPVYSDEVAMRKVSSPDLLRCLKGKSCFYIKTTDAAIMRDIEHALAEGFKIYEQRGWI